MISIQELSRKTRITPRTLRHYEAIGLLFPSGTTPGGHRLYSDKDVERLHKILYLKNLGLELKDIRNMLEQKNWSWNEYFQERFNYIKEEQAKLKLIEKRLREIQTVFRLEGELNGSLVAELITLSQQDPNMHRQFLERNFSSGELEKLKHLPSVSTVNSSEQEWLEIFEQVKGLVGTDPGSSEMQRVVERINDKARELFGEDEKLMLKLWEIRKSSELSQQMRLFPISTEMIEFLEQAFKIFEAKNPIKS